MKQIWFKKTGWIYIPANAMGYLVSILAIVFMIPVVIAVDKSAHSVSDELYTIFIYFSCTAFWWKWVAEKTTE